MTNRSKLLLFVLVLLLALCGAVIWYMTSFKNLRVNYKNAHNIKIYKTSSLDSGDGYNPVATIDHKGQVVRLRGGSYTLHYDGNEGYESRYVTVNVTEKEQEFSITPEYSGAKLGQLLDSELPSIKAALASKYPRIGSYEIRKGKLYNKGDWYATILVYKGDYGTSSDSLRVVMHKERGRWVVRTDPPNITLSKLIFSDVPVDILRDINSAPVPDPDSTYDTKGQGGGAHPRYF